jgi:hypothetical protein
MQTKQNRPQSLTTHFCRYHCARERRACHEIGDFVWSFSGLAGAALEGIQPINPQECRFVTSAL